MMTLDEAIQHAEEDAKELEYTLKVYRDIKHYDSMSIHSCEKVMEGCKAYAEEHRQLAEWLKELKRARTLLKATHELLMKQNDSDYVLNLLGETIFYDEAECNGCCLMNDIEDLLEYGV